MHRLIIVNLKRVNAFLKINMLFIQIQLLHLLCDFVNVDEAQKMIEPSHIVVLVIEDEWKVAI